MVLNHQSNAQEIAVCNSIIAKETSMKNRLQDSQKYARMLCERFRHAKDENGNAIGGAVGDNIEALLLSISAEGSKSSSSSSSNNNHRGNNTATESFITGEQVTTFFDEQRARLKAAAEKNVATERSLDNLIGSMRVLKNQIQREEEEDATMRNNNANGEAGDEGQEHEQKPVVKDYEAMIADLMQQHDASTPRLELWQATAYRQVCESLGETLPSNAAQGAGGAAAQSGNNAEDDDIQFVPTAGSKNMTLKCPITTMFMEEPMRNKLCGHSYGLQAIAQLIINARGRQGCKCPVAGCTNANVTMEQLDKDLEAEYAIKRRRRAEEHETQQRASQANDLEDTDEEE
jgi:Zinc-finger of the MIZ type in Nse subunit